MLSLWSVVYAWLYNGSGGALFTALLFHAAWNTPKPLTLTDAASAQAEALAGLATLGLWVTLALVAYHGRAYLAADAPDPRISGRRDR